MEEKPKREADASYGVWAYNGSQIQRTPSSQNNGIPGGVSTSLPLSYASREEFRVVEESVIQYAPGSVDADGDPDQSTMAAEGIHPRGTRDQACP